MENYNQSENAETVDVSGKWKLSVEFQGQQIPVTLVAKQTDNELSGRLDSMLGGSDFSGGKVQGNKISASSTNRIQGQSVDITVSGTVEGDTISGTISTSFPLFPSVNFSGKREV